MIIRSALNVPKHFMLIFAGKCPQFHWEMPTIPHCTEASSDTEPEPGPEPAQSGKTTSVVPRPDDWKGQREREENITDEERHRMQAEEGSSSEQDKPRVPKDKGRVGGLKSKLDLRPPIVPVIKPSDHEAIQNRNEELSDDERARAMQQTGPFPGPHPVGPSCWTAFGFCRAEETNDDNDPQKENSVCMLLLLVSMAWNING
ncbi:hypothetical protein LguiB_026434 [Lonicera macranthoides]